MKIIEGPKGLFVAMPSKKQKEGTYGDIVHPVNAETRKMIERTVIAEYKQAAADQSDASSGALPSPHRSR